MRESYRDRSIKRETWRDRMRGKERKRQRGQRRSISKWCECCKASDLVKVTSRLIGTTKDLSLRVCLPLLRLRITVMLESED